MTSTNLYIFVYRFNITRAGCAAFAGCEKNTYQLVILTDHEQTYTIMNYHDLTWQDWGQNNMAAVSIR